MLLEHWIAAAGLAWSVVELLDDLSLQQIYVKLLTLVHIVQWSYLVEVRLTPTSARNKVQKLVGHFFEDRTFCRLLITIPLKIYSIFG